MFEEVSEQVITWLRKNWLHARRHLDKQYQRTLPFGEYIVDRWEKARELGFGEGSSIYDSSIVFGNVKVGRNTWIGPFTILDGSGGLEIGYNCSISAGVRIYTHDTVDWALTEGQRNPAYAPVKIGNCCYIGPNVVISKGVSIGSGSVVGACSLVIHDIPPKSKAFGTPAQVVGRVESHSDAGSDENTKT